MKTNKISWQWIVIALAIALSFNAIVNAYLSNQIIAYGDAESHLNIAKRVIHSLTPGAAQIGGVWLPLPHLLMLPFVYFDSLWRSGLAGAIVSGIAFVISSLYIFKLAFLLTKHQIASFVAFLAFALNPNILYLQTTPMSEIPLLMFFILSSFYFIKFLIDNQNVLALLFAAFFGFCATLSRYDGWLLVLVQALIIAVIYVTKPYLRKETEGKFILFSTAAFFGILLWLLWDFLILGDPLYFTNSAFSAKSQQQGWLMKGQLPAYNNIYLSFIYYVTAVIENSGQIIFILSFIGFIVFNLVERSLKKILITLVLLVPFLFYVITLYLGQSIIFLPNLTPKDYEWNLFNVRYGTVAIPAIALFFGFLFYKSKRSIRFLLIIFLIIQSSLFYFGITKTITLEDGIKGLSASRKPDVEGWISTNYDHGLILLDDYARTMSIIRSGLPIQNIIYIGNKKYWDESLIKPEKHARWIIMQKNDAVWKSLNNSPTLQSRLYKYFNKVYTSPQILVFRKINDQ